MGKPSGPSEATQKQEQQITAGELALAQQQDTRAQQLYNLTEPGLETAVSHYQKLATGDPNTLFKEVAPGAEQISQKFDKAKANLAENAPRGGARDLAMEEADISKAGAVGGLVNQAYSSSFPALANLAGKGIGLSINEVGNAIAAFGGASNTAANLAQQQEAGKASSMGFLSALGGDAAQMFASV
jgi:hypothetical protein